MKWSLNWKCESQSRLLPQLALHYGRRGMVHVVQRSAVSTGRARDSDFAMSRGLRARRQRGSRFPAAFRQERRAHMPTAVRQLSCARGHVCSLSGKTSLSASTLRGRPCSLHAVVTGDIKFGLVFVNCPCLPVRTLPLTRHDTRSLLAKRIGRGEGRIPSQSASAALIHAIC